MPPTASPLPAQWKAWHAAHPKAPSKTVHYSGPSVGTGSRLEAWADEITLGNLTLTDIPVLQATPFEVSWIPDYAGSLGMYALQRMELITDGKNNIAYLHPLPPPGPYYQGFKRPGINGPDPDPAARDDWTVAPQSATPCRQPSMLIRPFQNGIITTTPVPSPISTAAPTPSTPKNLDAYLARARRQISG